MSLHLDIRDAIPFTTLRGTPEETIPLKDENDLYNPYKVPADLDFAQTHSKAKRVYAKNPADAPVSSSFCACCGLPVEGKQLPVNCELSSLYHLGSGYALYFQFTKHCIALLTIMFGISGIYNLYTNYQSGDCGDVPVTSGTQYCLEDWVITFTIANKRDHIDELSVQLMLNLLTIIAIAIYFHYIRYQTRKTIIAADDETITPADYTLQLKGVPEGASEEDIKSWLENQADPEHPIKVQKVCKTYEISRYVRDLRLKQELTERKSDPNCEKEEIEERLREVEARLEQTKKKGLRQTDIAFAIFVRAAHADHLKKKFEKSKFEKLLEVAKIIRKAKDHFKGVKIVLRRAPEPTDILWENLGSSLIEKFAKRILIGLATFFLVFGGFTFIVAISWVQILIVDNAGEDSVWLEILTIMISIVITAMDPIIGITTGKLVSHQKFSTCTGYYTAVAEYLSVSQFINTAFTTLFAKLVLSMQFNPQYNLLSDIKITDFYGSAGVVKSTFFVFITNAFVNPIINIYDPIEILKKYLQKKAHEEGKNNTLTQQEANEIFEGQDFGIDWKYGYMVETMLFVSFYAPSIPMALPMTIVGLILSYWSERFVLVRRAVLPNSLSSQLQESMIEYLEWIGFMFALGNLIVFINLEDLQGRKAIDTCSTTLIFLCLVASLIHIFFPMQLLNEKLFPLVDEVTEFIDYDEARLTFLSDYEIANPVTSRKAIKSLLLSLKEKRGDNINKITKPNVPSQEVVTTYFQHLLGNMNQDGDDDNPFGQLDKYSKEMLKPEDIVRKKLKNAKFTGVASKINRGFAEGLGTMIFKIANQVEPRDSSGTANNRPSSNMNKSQSQEKSKSNRDSGIPGLSGNFFLNLLKNPESLGLGDEQTNKKKNSKSNNDLEMRLLGGLGDDNSK